MLRQLCSMLVIAAAMLGVGGAAPAQAFEKAIWELPTFNGQSQFPIFQDLGATIYQYQLSWAQTAPTRPLGPSNPADPAYQWPADLDYAVSQASAHRMKLAIMLIGSPSWANHGRAWNWAPSNPQDFANFATAAARRYPYARYWLIWGEPSRALNFQPLTHETSTHRLAARQAVAPRLYARLLDASYRALKRVNRRNLVIGGNTLAGGDISTLNWMRYMRLPNGRAPRMDLYGHNPFSFRDPNLRDPPSVRCFAQRTARCFGDMSDVRRVLAALDRYVAPRRNLRLFLSEYTIPTAPDRDFNFWVSRATQARWIRDALRICRRVPRIVALGWAGLYDRGPDSLGNQVTHAGLLDYQGLMKPGYLAFKRG